MVERAAWYRRLEPWGSLGPGLVVAVELLDLPLETELALGGVAWSLWMLTAGGEKGDQEQSWIPGVVALVLLPLAVMTRSTFFLVAGLSAFVGMLDRQRRRSALRGVLVLLATFGMAMLYLRTIHLWIEGPLDAVSTVVISWFGLQGGGGGAYVLLAGQHVHVSLMSPFLAMVIATAMVLIERRKWSVGLALVVAGGSVLVCLKVGFLVLLPSLADAVAEPRIALLLASFAAVVVRGLWNRPRRESMLPAVPARAAWLGGSLGVLVLLATSVPSRSIQEIEIDESHGSWETTLAAYTPAQYGRHTVYNYSLLRKWWEERFAVRTASDLALQPSGELLVVKMPTRRFRDEERRAVRKFVREGGGLLVFADHTDLFGSSSIINELLVDYGLEVEPTATLPRQGVTRRFAGRWWTGSRLASPGNALDLQTTATIRAVGLSGLLTESNLTDTGVVAESADYSNERRFGELTISADDDFRGSTIVASRKYGLGTVVVVADSTPWSNFSLLAPGNREFLRGVIELFETPPVPFPAALASALLALMAAASTGRFGWTPSVLCFLATLSLGTGILAAVGRVEGAESVRFSSGETLAVLEPFSEVFWDTDIRTGGGVDKSVFSLFFATMPRVGVYPGAEDIASLSSEVRLAALVNPSGRLAHRHMFALESWVRDGGTLLIMGDPLWHGSEALLPVLDHMGFGHTLASGDESVWRAAGPALPEHVYLLALSLLQDQRHHKGERLLTYGEADYGLLACEPLWVDDKGLAILGERKLGQGRVVALIRSRVFSQSMMGDVWGGVEPGRFRQESYELEYRLLQILSTAERR